MVKWATWEKLIEGVSWRILVFIYEEVDICDSFYFCVFLDSSP